MMKTKTSKTEPEDWALPKATFTRKEFIENIRLVEEGPFYSLEEIKSIRQQWRKEQKSQ